MLQNYVMQVPRGFSVQVFKGPTLSSFPYTATAKFDIGYRSTTNSDSRQRQNWYSSRPVTNENSFSAPREHVQSSLFVANGTRQTYESNRPRTTSSFSIYPSVSKDTYIYERSLSSKSDLYSNSEYGSASTLTLTPSSILSPTLSTDSTTTLKSAVLTERVLDPSRTDRSSTSTSSSRHPLPTHITAVAQAPSPIRGIFLNHTPQEDLFSHSNNSFIPRAPSTRPSDLPDPGDHTRFHAEAAAAQDRGSTPIQHPNSSSGSTGPDTPGQSTSYSTSTGFSERQHFTHNMIAESDNGEPHDEASRQVRMNTEFNSVSATSYQTGTNSADLHDFRPVTHVSAVDRHSVPLALAEPTDGRSQQVYSDFTIRSSPEQQHNMQSRGDSTYAEPPSFYGVTPPTSSSAERQSSSITSYYPTITDSDDRLTSQSDDFVPLFARRDITYAPGEELSSASVSRAPSDQRAFPQNTQDRSEIHVPEFFSFDAASQPVTNNIGYDSVTVPSSSSSASAGSDNRQNRTIPSPHPVPLERCTYDGYKSSSPRHQVEESRRNTRDSAYNQEFFQAKRDTTSNAEPQPVFAGSRYETIDYNGVRNVVMPMESATSNGYIASSAVPGQPHNVRERDERSHSRPVSRSSVEHHDFLRTRRESSAAEVALRNTGYRPVSLSSCHPVDCPQEPRVVSIPSTQSQSLHASAQCQTNPNRMSNTPYHQSAPQSVPAPRELYPTVPSDRERECHDNNRARNISGVLPRSATPERVLDIPPTEVAPRNLSTMQQFSDSVPLFSEPQRGYHSNEHSHGITVTRQSSPPAEGISNSLLNLTVGQGNRALGRDQPTTLPPPVFSVAEPQRNSPDIHGTQDVPTVHQRSSTPVDRIRNHPPARQAASDHDGQQFLRSRVPPPTEPHRRHSDGDRPISSATFPQRFATPFERTPNPPSNQSGSNHPNRSHSSNLEPQRRHSDGDQVIPQRSATPRETVTITPVKRTVRWNENLISPSPIFPSQRRKGWFNRRGYV